jgi:hypothetical protein
MAIAKRSNTTYTTELALNKRIDIEQNFAQQSYTVFREIKFGITPYCYVDYESAAITHFISEWKYSKSNKIIVSTEVPGIFLEPLAPINDTASLACPVIPSNVCTIVDLASLLNAGSTYTQCFDADSLVWTVTHNLGKFPSVTIVDTDNNIVVGEVVYVNSNIIQVTFSSVFAGCVFLN